MKFAELLDKISESYPAKFIFTGGPSDEEYEQGILGQLRFRDRVIDGPRFSLEELGALFQRLNLFVTINTGPMHIAISQNTPTLAIIGVVPARVIYPSGNPRFQHVMDPALEVWDTTAIHPKYVPRIEEIAVEEVYRKAKYLLDHFAQPAHTEPAHSQHH